MEMLKNNSEEMKTVVEPFVIEETQELIYDNEKLNQWNKLVSTSPVMGVLVLALSTIAGYG